MAHGLTSLHTRRHIMRGIPKEAVRRKLPIAGTNYTCDEAALEGSDCAWNHWMTSVRRPRGGRVLPCAAMCRSCVGRAPTVRRHYTDRVPTLRRPFAGCVLAVC